MGIFLYFILEMICCSKKGNEITLSRPCQQSPKLLESRFRVLSEHRVFSSSKHTVAKHHLKLDGEMMSYVEESGCLAKGGGGSRGLNTTHSQEPIAQEDHKGKEVADEGVSQVRKLPQLLASGGWIKVKSGEVFLGFPMFFDSGSSDDR